jgi:hypothetical protein
MKKDGDHDTMSIHIPTDGVTITGSGHLEFNEERVSEYSYDTGKKYLKCSYRFYINNGEPDLYIRIKKALDHLATFCPKKKETF